MAEKKKLSRGDIVVVKGLPNSPVMLVEIITPIDVLCCWFMENGHYQQAEFYPECLEPAEDRIEENEKRMRERMESYEKLMLGEEDRLKLMTNDESESES